MNDSDSMKCGYCSIVGVKLSLCSRCHSISYCDTVCQRKNWPDHKSLCKKAEPVSTTQVTAASKYPDSFATFKKMMKAEGAKTVVTLRDVDANLKGIDSMRRALRSDMTNEQRLDDDLFWHNSATRSLTQ